MPKQVKVGVAVAVVNENYEILLGKRIAKKGKLGNGSWQLPGGHQEFGEFTHETAVRELLEETNLQIRDPWFVCFTEERYSTLKKQYVTFFYVAKAINPKELQNTEPHKCEGWEWFKINGLPDNLFEITPNTRDEILTAIRQIIVEDHGKDTEEVRASNI